MSHSLSTRLLLVSDVYMTVIHHTSSNSSFLYSLHQIIKTNLHTNIGIRLGCQLCREIKCIRGEFVYRKGSHTLPRSKATGRYLRQAEVNNTIGKALVSAEIPAQ